MLTKLVKPLKNQSGFTLVEMLVVIAITGIVVVMISEIFVNIVQGNINSTVTNNVRAQGQQMVETISRNISNADQVLIAGNPPSSTTTTNTITLSIGGNLMTYTFQCSNLDQNGSNLNASGTLIDTSPAHCTPLSYSDTGQYSYFVVTPATSNAPAEIKIVLTLYTQAPGSSHQEYITRQTITRGTMQLGQYKK